MAKRIVAFLVVVCALGFGLWISQKREEPAKVSGTIEARDVRLGSRVGGRVAKVGVEEGQAVKAGDLLVQFEPYDLQERGEKAAARLEQEQAVLSRVEAGYRVEEIAQARARRDELVHRLDLLKVGAREEDLAAARSQVELAQAEFENARSTHERTEALVVERAASREELDEATERLKIKRALLAVRNEELAKLERGTRKEELDEAAARVEEANQALRMLENGHRPEEIRAARAELEEAEEAWKLMVAGSRPEEKAEARAAVRAAEAELAGIDRQKGELSVFAPTDGVVEAIELSPGDIVASGAPFLTLLDPSELRVRAYVPESRLSLEVGAPVVATVDAFPGESFRCRVTYLAREAEFVPRNVQTPEERRKLVFRIRAVLEEGTDRVRPGMSVDLWLEGEVQAR